MYLIVLIFGPASYYSAKIEMMINFYSDKAYWLYADSTNKHIQE